MRGCLRGSEGYMDGEISGAPRFVIFHTPGRNWRPDVSPIEQEGVAAHLEYLRGLADQGIIALSGPFIEGGSGGMIITAADIDESAAQAIGTNDPAVASGLINFELRRWLLTVGTIQG